MASASLHLQAFSAKALWWLAFAAPYTAAGALLLTVIALLLMLSLRRRFTRLALGRAGSLEETIAVLSRDAREMKEFKNEVEKYLQFTEARLRGSVQGVGVVRFNPFAGAGQGGNQSFAAAFLDESGSGMVLSTLYARERVGVYCKPIEKGASSYELTGEEQEAIAKAKAAIVERKKNLTPKKK